MPVPLAKAIQLGKPSWPNPEKSVGTAFGPIPKTKLSYWSTKGPAQEAYQKLLPKLQCVLLERQGRIPNCDFLWFSPYMIGQSTSTSAPFIMFSSEQRQQRRMAMKHIKKSKMLEEYPGMQTGEWPEPPHIGRQIQMASLEDITYASFSDIPESIAVESLLEDKDTTSAILTFRYSDRIVKATSGLQVTVNEQTYYLVPAHVLSGTAAPLNGIKSGRCQDNDGLDFGDFHGEEDFSDADSDSDGLESEELFGTGSTLSSQSGYQSSDSITQHDEMVLSEPHCYNDAASLSSSTAPSSPTLRGLCTVPPAAKALGACPLMSLSLDYALCTVTDLRQDSSEGHLSDFISLSNTIAEPDSAGTDIRVLTSHGCLKGVLFRMGTQVHFPNSLSYQEVYEARFDSPVLPGDCGAIVYGAIGNSVFGHIVTGSADPRQRSAFVVPAKDVYADLVRHFGESSSEMIVPSIERDSKLTDDIHSFTEKLSTKPKGSQHLSRGIDQDDSRAFNRGSPINEIFRQFLGFELYFPLARTKALGLGHNLEVLVMSLSSHSGKLIAAGIHYDIKPSNIFLLHDSTCSNRVIFQFHDADKEVDQCPTSGALIPLVRKDMLTSTEIFSLGYVLIEAAVCMAWGVEGVMDFRKERRKITEYLKRLHATVCRSSSHNSNRIPSVLHKKATETRKLEQRAAYIVYRIIEFIIQEVLLGEGQQRKTPQHLATRFQHLLDSHESSHDPPFPTPRGGLDIYSLRLTRKRLSWHSYSTSIGNKKRGHMEIPLRYIWGPLYIYLTGGLVDEQIMGNHATVELTASPPTFHPDSPPSPTQRMPIWEISHEDSSDHGSTQSPQSKQSSEFQQPLESGDTGPMASHHRQALYHGSLPPMTSFVSSPGFNDSQYQTVEEDCDQRLPRQRWSVQPHQGSRGDISGRAIETGHRERSASSNDQPSNDRSDDEESENRMRSLRGHILSEKEAPWSSEARRD
ncbi:hypothetical protein F5Y16DRAFT_403139 [Xylariaceae sp. FL0255]|nr:hypothetical protein F5Y16DRAFT_403139 [Xylariaceae sp. FL0255]